MEPFNELMHLYYILKEKERDVMKITLKRTLAMGLMAIMFALTFFPANVAFAAPKKMSLEDFYYYLPDGSDWSFMEVEDEGPRMELLGEDCKTKRGIKVGDKASKVTSKYGKTTKKKVSNKDSFTKFMSYYSEYYEKDTSKWKYYLEYTYKKGTKNSRTLRFYLNAKNKVVDVLYIHRINYFKLNKKSIDIDLKFVAPKGKKITTKKIGGKKVQILPNGTKIKYNNKKVPKDSWGYNYGLMFDIKQINNKGKEIGKLDYPITIGFIKNNSVFDELLEREMNSVSAKDGAYKGDLDMNKLGKYKYFKMTIYDNDWEDGFDKPVTRYFKY